MSAQYAIVGCGGVGGYYGGLLQKAGFDVHFLARSDYAHLKKHGLKVDSVNGNFSLPRVNVYDSPASMPKCRTVVVALKTTANHLLPEILPPILEDGGTVVLLQNGMGQEEIVAEFVSGATIVGGLAFLCSFKAGAGHIKHVDYGRVVFGQYSADGKPAGITPAVTRIADDFKKCGLEVHATDFLLSARWEKLVWNIPFNGLAVLLNATTAQLMSDGSSRGLVNILMREVAAGAAADATAIEESFIEKMVAYTVKMAPYAPSMKLDYDAGREMELEAIYAIPLKRALDKGVQMPATETLYRLLFFLNKK